MSAGVITIENVPFTGNTAYVGAAIENFFIAVFYLLRAGKSPTQTFSFSVRIRRELDAGAIHHWNSSWSGLITSL
ncbi:hypothetical protein [Serratia inhibens]|uniref:Uncharacterized protein n=1 Tax=Serratia inhibens TaxID=2338073 RepID=A0AA93BWV6_9GAMM|nr:hypothetical protein [Serratia inhibens]RJF56296.1 hypothetical protein D4100_11985 [Serratia inhibens]